MLSFGSGYKTGKSPHACTPPLRLYHPVLIEQRSVAGLSLEPSNFGVIAWSADRYEHDADLRSKTIWPGVGLSMLMRAKRFNYLLQIRVEDEQKRDLDDTAQRFSTTPAALARLT